MARTTKKKATKKKATRRSRTVPKEWPAAKVETRATSSLVPYARNARTHTPAQVAKIAASIREWGWTNPVLVDESNGIIAGHGRILAAELEGIETVPVMIARGWSDAQRRAYVIADNKLALDAGWDLDTLGAEIEELTALDFDIGLTGFEPVELGDLFPADTPEENVTPIPLPENPITQEGDVWILGEHRIACGSCADADTMDALVQGRALNLAVTSPPYASQRKYDEESEFEPVPPSKYLAWWKPVQDLVAQHLADDGSFFVNIKEHCEEGQRHLYVKDLTLAMVRKWGWLYVDEFVWTHGGTPKAVNQRFKNGWEPIFQFARARHKFRPDSVMHRSDNVPDWQGDHPSKQHDGQHRQGSGVLVGTVGRTRDIGEGIQGQGLPNGGIPRSKKQRRARNQGGSNADLQGAPAGGKAIHDAVEANTDGMAYPSNVLSLGKNRDALGHPASYPVKLPAFFMRAFSDEGDLVFDPFMGSGSTLIAAENEGRVCVGCDVSPGYVDVTVKRWQIHTGQEATRERDGATFSALAEDQLD